MPMIEACIPHDALSPEAEKALFAKLTDILLKAEGLDPANAKARAVSLVFVTRPAAVFVAGEPAAEPRYRITCAVPEGQLDDAKRATLVSEVTEAVLDAEQGARERSGARVWVFPVDVPDGRWGSRGKIQRLADIMTYMTGDAAASRAYAESRLAAARRGERF
jgi:phenylpyruvate tautomerase PptA (4-oxalocrotonate tautomerase family)